MSGVNWEVGPFVSTHLRGYLDNTPYRFEELVARLYALSGQKPDAKTDEYKTSVEFVGTFNGERFTLYDYKGDNTIHIGGTDWLHVDELKAALALTLDKVIPRAYYARLHYDDVEGQIHGWLGGVYTGPERRSGKDRRQ